MARKLTFQEVENRLNGINPNIKIIGEYVNTHSKTLCKCTICGYEWSPTIDKLFQGRGCPSCSKRVKGTTESFQKALQNKNLNFTVLGEYENRSTPVEVKCNECGHIWKVRPYDLLNKQGCPKCSGKLPLTQEEVESRIFKANPDVEVISSYISANYKLKCKCKICGNIWEASPINLFAGTGCPACKESKGEKYIRHYLEAKNVNFISQYIIKDDVFRSRNKVYVDFYLPDYNIFIEYNGKQHYIPINYFGGQTQLEEQKKRDEDLRLFCNLNAIQLIEIKYSEDIQESLDKLFNQIN